jgi:hypothetical protein
LINYIKVPILYVIMDVNSIIRENNINVRWLLFRNFVINIVNNKENINNNEKPIEPVNSSISYPMKLELNILCFEATNMIDNFITVISDSTE